MEVLHCHIFVQCRILSQWFGILETDRPQQTVNAVNQLKPAEHVNKWMCTFQLDVDFN